MWVVFNAMKLGEIMMKANLDRTDKRSKIEPSGKVLALRVWEDEEEESVKENEDEQLEVGGKWAKQSFLESKWAVFQGGEKDQVSDAADGSEKMRNENWPLHLVTGSSYAW